MNATQSFLFDVISLKQQFFFFILCWFARAYLSLSSVMCYVHSGFVIIQALCPWQQYLIFHFISFDIIRHALKKGDNNTHSDTNKMKNSRFHMSLSYIDVFAVGRNRAHELINNCMYWPFGSTTEHR